KMSGTESTAQMIRDVGRFHERQLRRGVHVVGFGGEDQIHSVLRADRRVLLERSRVALIVFRRAELKRIHKNADDNKIAFLPRTPDQACMPGVKGTHRGHKTDALAVAANTVELFTSL